MAQPNTRHGWRFKPVDEIALGLGGLALAAIVLLAAEASMGLHPGLNLALACVLALMVAWTTLGLRAAVGQPDLARWTRFLEKAEVQGTIAAVEVSGRGHGQVMLANLMPDAHLHVVDPAARAALDLPTGSCDAVVIGPGADALDETARNVLLDETVRTLHPRGRLVLVVRAAERRGLLSILPVEWQPGAPRGWWSDALADRFDDVRHAPLSRTLDVLLARRSDPEAPAS